MGGIDVGTTQYEDAFQRANFWSKISTHTSYHVLLGGPAVMPEQTLNAPISKGTIGNPFGPTVAVVDINWFDTRVQPLLISLKFQPNQLPIFLTYNTYLHDSSGCCIGGYHSAVTNVNGTEAYAFASYIDQVGNFAQDVSAPAPRTVSIHRWLTFHDNPFGLSVCSNGG